MKRFVLESIPYIILIVLGLYAIEHIPDIVAWLCQNSPYFN